MELKVTFEENFDWAHQRKLEKYEDLGEKCQKWLDNHCIFHRGRMPRFHYQLNLRILD